MVGWLRTYAASRLPCKVTVYQQMQINNEAVKTEAWSNYGSPNALVITVDKTSVTVSHAGVSITRNSHF